MHTEPTLEVNDKKLVISQVMKESWQLVKGFKWPVICTYFLPIIPYFLLVIMAVGLLSLLKTNPYFFLFMGVMMFFMICLSSAFFWVITCTLSVLGVRQAIGLPPRLATAFSQCMRAKTSLFLLFLVWLAFTLAYTLVSRFILHGDIGALLNILLYIVFLYCSLPIILFAIPLVVIKKYGVLNALSSGFNMMNKYYVEILPLYVLMMILVFISVIPLGIALIWTLPMCYAMTGILFRNLYGVKKKP